MDNATAEYTFISQFFASNQPSSTVDTSLSLLTPVASVPTPTMMATPDTAVFIENRSPVTSEYEGSSRQVSGFMPGLGGVIPLVNSKEEQALVDAIWKQIMDPVVDYSQVCLSFSHSRAGILHSFVPELCQDHPGTHSPCNSAVDHDPFDRRTCHRDSEKTVPTSREFYLWYSDTDVACLPEGYARAHRVHEEAC